MRVFLFTAFLFAVVTLTTGASVNNKKLNEKHSVKQHASRRVGNRLQYSEAKNTRPDGDSDDGVLESDLEEYKNDEWPDSDFDTIEEAELDLDEGSARLKGLAKEAKKAHKKASKAYKDAKGVAKKAATVAYKEAKKAAKTVGKGPARRRRRRRRVPLRHPRYTPATRPPRYTRGTRVPPKNPPKKNPPKKYPPKKYPTRYPPTRPPSKGSKYCPCRMVAKPAKECYSYTNAEKGYCRLRNCDAKWECLTSGRSKHICMRKFSMQKIIPAGYKGKLTKCRTIRHRPKTFYVLYRTIKSYPRPKPRPRSTKPGPYTRRPRPRHRPGINPKKDREPKPGRVRRRRPSAKNSPKVYRSKPKSGGPKPKAS